LLGCGLPFWTLRSALATGSSRLALHLLDAEAQS
jgi:hypothetical protein